MKSDRFDQKHQNNQVVFWRNAVLCFRKCQLGHMEWPGTRIH